MNELEHLENQHAEMKQILEIELAAVFQKREQLNKLKDDYGNQDKLLRERFMEKIRKCEEERDELKIVSSQMDKDIECFTTNLLFT